MSDAELVNAIGFMLSDCQIGQHERDLLDKYRDESPAYYEALSILRKNAMHEIHQLLREAGREWTP